LAPCFIKKLEDHSFYAVIGIGPVTFHPSSEICKAKPLSQSKERLGDRKGGAFLLRGWVEGGVGAILTTELKENGLLFLFFFPGWYYFHSWYLTRVKQYIQRSKF